MAPREFDFTPIPQPAAPARDLALTASSDGSQPLSAARLVPLDRLLADPDQPRKTFDDEALDELATSLRTAGMRQPITAYYDDNLEAFVVVSGERRLIAARRAGLTHAPVLVEHRPTSDADKLVLQLAENLVREDLTVPDEQRDLPGAHVLDVRDEVVALCEVFRRGELGLLGRGRTRRGTGHRAHHTHRGDGDGPGDGRDRPCLPEEASPADRFQLASVRLARRPRSGVQG